jgi:hypothetical protein
MDLALPKDFKEFLRLLRAHGVEYLLVGGWAVIYHGYPRATDELDIWISVSPANAARAARALRELASTFPNYRPTYFFRTIRLCEWGLNPCESKS